MPRTKSVDDEALLEAALEGLQLQKQRIEDQIQEVRSRLKGRRGTGPVNNTHSAAPHKRRLSAEARKRIAAAQRKRWEAFRRKSAARKGLAKAASPQ